MKPGHSLSELISAAQRRTVGNLALSQGAICLIAFFAAFALLLLLGTQVIHWIWPVSLGAAAAGYGVFRVARRVPRAYDTAQRLDHRLGFNDLLSTAYHFSTAPDSPGANSRFLETVAAEAERAAATAQIVDAMPVRWPKEAWIALALMAVSAGLLGVRYGVLHTLDLKSALVDISFDTFTGLPDAPAKKKGASTRSDELPPLTTLTVEDPPQPPEKDESTAPENALETVDVPDVNEAGMQRGEKKREALNAGDERGEQGETGEKGDPEGKGDEDQGANPPPNSNSAGKKPEGQQPKEANSLLDKMRDAFNNMLDKMNLQPKGQEGQQNAGQSKQQSAKGEKTGDKGQQSGAKSKGDPNSEQPGEQQGESSDDASGSNRSEGDKLEQASNDPRSGMGKQDGKKETELAEQLEAMGKISEILGKRSANITGEMMVEVQNSKQQLKTPYMNRQATHGEAGGEINRDEIPIHLQPYIQQYYEQVRKQPAKPAAKQ